MPEPVYLIRESIMPEPVYLIRESIIDAKLYRILNISKYLNSNFGKHQGRLSDL
jgi:hypothetical protein